VIDGTTNTTATISTGIGTIPNNVAVNPVTNTIYVTNLADATVSVIDGSSDTVSAVVTVGFSSQVNRTSIAVNPVTNKIYLPNSCSNTVSVIDGTDNSVTTITTGIGTDPNAVAINPVTNKIYVTNLADATVSVIDGFSGTVTAIVSTGFSSQANGTSIAVNPATNKIYVPNSFSNTVTVIDGATNTTTTISDMIGTDPDNLSINYVTNKIYVTNLADATVSVIDGSTDTVSAVVPVGSSSQVNRTSIAVNPVTNKIYVPNSFSNTVTVIDGATNTTTTVTPGTTSNNLAINLATNKIYVTNLADATVTVISEEQLQALPLITTIAPFPGNVSETSTPTFTFTPDFFLPVVAFAAHNAFLPSNPSSRKVYFQVDTWEGPWIPATPTGSLPGIAGSPIPNSPILPTYTGLSPTLRQGTHVVYAFTTDGEESTSTGLAQQFIGQIAAEVFTVILPGSSTDLSADTNPSGVGQTVTFTAAVSSKADGTPTGTVQFFDGATSLGSGTVTAGVATLATAALTLGSHDITAVYSGDANFGGSASAVLTEVIAASNPVPVATSLSPASATAGGGAFTLTVNGSNFVAGSVVRWDGADRTTIFVNATQLTASIPLTDIATAGTVAVTVFNPALGGGTSGPLTFTINNPVPVLTSISPSSAVGGGPAFTLTVNGSNFVSGSVVEWGGAARTTTFISSTQLTAAIPSTDLLVSGTVSVLVFNPLPGGGNSVNVATFTITVPVPVLTAIAPSSAAAGSPQFTMTLTGTSFISTSIARWNGTDLATTFISATQLTALVPAADILTVGSASVTVFNPLGAAQIVKTKVHPHGGGPSGQTSNALTFTITAENPTPVAASLSPASVSAGGSAFTLTVTGSSFVSGSTILWNGVALTTTFVSSTQLTATVPAGDFSSPGTASVTVYNPTPSGGVSGPLTVTVTQVVTTTTLAVSPTPPVAGQPITFTITISPAPSGASNGTVNIFDGTILLGTATVNSSGVATFTVSSLATGDHSITAVFSGTASSAASTSAPVNFTVTGAASFAVMAPTTPFTLMQGGSVSIPITVPPVGGAFNSSVTMSATGLPPGATASFNPLAVTPGTAGAPTVLTIQLAKSFAGSPAAPRQPWPLAPFALLTFATAALGLLLARRLALIQPRFIRLAFATAGLAGAVILFAGCNGGLSAGSRTPAGTYVVVITGTSGAQHASTSVKLVVE
jgi:YVTN family beta-propeller protein